MQTEALQPNVPPASTSGAYSVRFWAVAVIGGALAGICGGLLMDLLRAVQHFAYSYSEGDFLGGAGRAAAHRRVIALLLAGVVVAGVRLLLAVSGQRARGLTTAIWKYEGDLPLLATLVRAVMSIVIVGLGVALGREAALKDIGAVISSKLSDGLRLRPGERKVLVACAAGAGMAAAYNVPFGGGLFAAEVLLGSMSLGVIVPAIMMSWIATAASWLLLPARPTYEVPIFAFHPLELAWALLAAPFLALMTVLWVRSVVWAAKRKPNGITAYVSPAAVFACLGLLAVFVPDVLGNGKGLVQRAFVDQFGFKFMSLLLVLKLISTTACLATGTPGGLFTPTMTLGALLGSLLGRGWAWLVPGVETGASRGLYAVIGSTAVLSAATMGPVSSIVMMLELTANADRLIVPMMLATAVTMLIAGRWERRSIYSARS